MKDSKKIDLNILDELIAKCEDSMVHPFKKKKEVEEVEASKEEPDSEEGDEKPDLSDMEMEDLLEMYKDLKDRD